MNKITISTGHPDAGRVYAEAYGEALAREATLREELSVLEHWRDLALQFDNHRMKALWHLKTLAADGAHYDAARNFLSEPPIPASDLQHRLTVAEQRESEAREELLELSGKLDVFYSRSHGIKNLSEIEKANDEAKNLKLKVREYEVLLNISKELLTTISRHGATTKPVDWCDSFKAEVAGRIKKIGAALKLAAER